MYPTTKAAVPAAFSELVQPAKYLLFSGEEVAANRKQWIDEWQQASQQ
jgi:thiamine transport system substrate-binding protein